MLGATIVECWSAARSPEASDATARASVALDGVVDPSAT